MISETLHLLARQINRWQMAAFVLANLFGMTIVLSAIQFASDVVPLFTQGDSFMRPGQLVVIKHVSAARTLSRVAPVFSQNELKELSHQPFVKSIGLFTPSQFNVYATIGSSEMGMSLSTDMFFEAVPDEYLDIDLSLWNYQPDNDTIPIILPKNYLNLYNFGFAGSRGLPTISEGLVSKIILNLRLSGPGGQWFRHGKVVAFSKRLNTILVPLQFLRQANLDLAPQSEAQPSRLIVNVKSPADERIARFLVANNYDTESGDGDTARMASMLSLVSTIVLIIGLVICSLAFYVLLLSIYLLLQKHTEKIDTLLLIGHSPQSVALPFHLLAHSLNFITLILAFFLTTMLRRIYLPHFGELYPRYEAASFTYTIIVGLFIFALVAVLNHQAIKRKVMQIWNLHKK